MPESLSGFPLLKDSTSPYKLWLIQAGNHLPKEAIFHGNMDMGQPILPSLWNLPFFHMDLQLHGAWLLLFFKIYKIYRQYYSLTSFSTWLHVFFLRESQINHFSLFQWKFPYMLNCVQWARCFYVRLLGAQSKQYFPTMCSDVLVKSGHQTRHCERGCTDPVQSARSLLREFF